MSHNQKDNKDNDEDEFKEKKPSLDDFKILKCIGEGAFGEVYLVKHYFNGKRYALKCIDKKFMVKQKKEHHVYNEKLILEYLNSNMVVKLYTTFKDENKLYFLMENVPNGELGKYLNLKSKLIRKIDFKRSNFFHSRNYKYSGIYT